MKNKKLFLITTLIFLLDRITKTILLKKNILYFPIVKGYLSITLLSNTGAAFSLLRGQQFFLIAVSSLAVTGFLYYLSKKNLCIFQSLAWGFLLGGAFGNLFDRIVYRYVIDFVNIEFLKFPVFNVADTAITIGAIMLLAYTFMDGRKQNA